jgi:hypothetical protein
MQIRQLQHPSGTIESAAFNSRRRFWQRLERMGLKGYEVRPLEPKSLSLSMTRGWFKLLYSIQVKRLLHWVAWMVGFNSVEFYS